MRRTASGPRIWCPAIERLYRQRGLFQPNDRVSRQSSVAYSLIYLQFGILKRKGEFGELRKRLSGRLLTKNGIHFAYESITDFRRALGNRDTVLENEARIRFARESMNMRMYFEVIWEVSLSRLIVDTSASRGACQQRLARLVHCLIASAFGRPGCAVRGRGNRIVAHCADS